MCTGRRGARRGRGGRGEAATVVDRRLVERQLSRAVALERRPVVVVVEQVEATVQLVGAVDLRNEFEPQRHLGASVAIPSYRPRT